MACRVDHRACPLREQQHVFAIVRHELPEAQHSKDARLRTHSTAAS